MSNYPEQEPLHESLNEAQEFSLIDGIGNHEAKLLTTALITSYAEDSFTANRLYKELVGRQGLNVEWNLHDEVAFKYCVNSLAPIGAVTRCTIESRRGLISAFTATQFGAEYGLPFAGALLDWSLEHPDISIQKVFGPTATTGETRSPSTRFLIYSALLTGNDTGVSYTNIDTALKGYNINKKVLDKQLRVLDDIGIITTDSKMVDYNPQIRIIDPGFSHVSYTFEDLKTTTQVFYNAMGELSNRGTREVDLNTFLAVCQQAEPTVDLRQVRRLFTEAVSDKTANFASNVELVDKGIVGEQRTRVSLTDEYRTPIVELCNRIETIKGGEGIEAYKKRAKDILTSPGEFALLMGKAQRFSSSVKGQEAGGAMLQQKIERMLREIGPLTVRQVSEQLDEQNDSFNIETVRVAMNELLKAKKLASTKIVPDPSKKTVVSQYGLPT